ncbi:MAG: ABC transporter permease [Deltaproteobacteria bacterium]|nr:ABC transporter permease [Deltaproteobacteria bacterium]
MFGRVYAIGLNTFREAVRDRVLYGVLAIASAILLFTLALGELSLDQQRRVVMDVGLASISLFSVVISIFLGSSLLYKEIEKKTLYVILPKPIRRSEFLIGKYLGITLTGGTFVALMGSILLWVMAVQADASVLWLLLCPSTLGLGLGLALWRAHDRTAVLLPFALVALICTAALALTTDAPVASVLASYLLNVGELLLLTAVALLFSSFSTPFLTGAFTAGVWVLGRSAGSMAHMRSSALSDGMKSALHFMAEITPNFDLFVPPHQTLTEHTASMGPLGYLASSMGYSLIYSAILLTFAALIFRRRDFL